MNKDIKEKARELTSLTEELRERTEELMQEWAEVSECEEEIKSDTSILYDSLYYHPFKLVAGSDEIEGEKIYHEGVYRQKNPASLPPEDLREFLRKFPAMVEEIAKKMQKREKESRELISFLQKMRGGEK